MNWKDKNYLIRATQNSNSYAEIIKKIGLVPAGGNYKQLQYYLTKYSIETKHLKGQAWSKDLKVGPKTTKEILFAKHLVKGSSIKSYRLKEYLIKFNIKKNQCEICSQLPIWNNEKLVMHLDHIDGNNTNNILVNLRICCPNCHSQTNTYTGKKQKNFKLRETFNLDKI